MRRAVPLTSFIALSCILVAVACVDVPDEAADHRFRCASSSDCVSGFTCGQGYCIATTNPTNIGGGSMGGGADADAATSFAASDSRSSSGSGSPSPGTPDASVASTSGNSCQPNDHLGCFSGELYYFDTCGDRGALVNDCQGRGCTGEACNAACTGANGACSASCPCGVGYLCTNGQCMVNCSTADNQCGPFCSTTCSGSQCMACYGLNGRFPNDAVYRCGSCP